MRDSKTIIYCGDLGVGGWHGIVFGIDGVCPGIPATNYKDATKIMVKTDVKAKSINNDRQCEQGGGRTVWMYLLRTRLIPYDYSRRSWLLYRTYFSR